MTPIDLRPVTDGDAQFLFEVYASTRDDLNVLGWPPEQLRDFVSMQHLAQTTDYRKRFPHADYSIVTHMGEMAGRLWVDRGPDEIRVLDISLLPEFRGRAIGTTLFERLQAEAAQRDVPLRDSVATDNPRAEALYLRLGFREIAQSATYKSLEWTP